MANEGSVPNTDPAGGEAGSQPVPSDLGRELRRRREQLRLSVRRAAKRVGVSPTVISGIETGRRLPTLRTVERLRQGLGLDLPPAMLVRRPQPRAPLELHLVRLGACLWAAGGRLPLADLAAALELPTAAVREQLPALAERLAACGVQLQDDSVEVRCSPMPAATPALEALGRVTTERRRRVLSEEACVALAYIGWHREATRRELEALRGGGDCESLLSRLTDAGYVAAVRDREGRRPNRYRLTTVALEALGVASLEELHDRVAPMLTGDARPPSTSAVTTSDAAARRDHSA